MVVIKREYRGKAATLVESLERESWRSDAGGWLVEAVEEKKNTEKRHCC